MIFFSFDLLSQLNGVISTQVPTELYKIINYGDVALHTKYCKRKRRIYENFVRTFSF